MGEVQVLCWYTSGGGRDAVRVRLLDLIGLGNRGAAEPDSSGGRRISLLCGIAGARPRSASGAEAGDRRLFRGAGRNRTVCRDWKGWPVNAIFFKEGQSISERLGLGAVVGDEVWDQQRDGAVRLGPLPFGSTGFPARTARACRALRAWLGFSATGSSTSMVQLVLRGRRVRRASWARRTGGAAARVGYLDGAEALVAIRATRSADLMKDGLSYESESEVTDRQAERYDAGGRSRRPPGCAWRGRTTTSRSSTIC